MKRICNFLLSFCIVLGLCSCAGSKTTWQEQYDLGIKYLNAGNYEEAIIAFDIAIEIDPRLADAYIGLADVYTAQGAYDAALEILQQGMEHSEDSRLSERINQINQALNAEKTASLIEELRPVVESLNIPFTVDEVALGATDISVPIAAYSDRPYARSNLMNNETENTVYTCFGMDGMPIPEGHEESEFGFLFAGPSTGGPVHCIIINDSSFQCMNACRVGDDASVILELFGVQDVIGRLAEGLSFHTENGKQFELWGNPDNFVIVYEQDGNMLEVSAYNGVVFSVLMERSMV